MELLKNVQCRTIISIIVFWGQIQNYMMRISLSLIIVEMVRDRPVYNQSGNRTAVLDYCSTPAEPIVYSNSHSQEEGVPVSERDDDKLDWDEATVGLILSSFSWGYMTSQILGGRLAELYGFKLVYGVGIGLPGFLMLLHPLAAWTSPQLFMCTRVLLGILTGVTWPAMHAITARWVPKSERSSFIAQTYFGTTFGLVITFPMCGYIIDRFGWAACYYVIFGLTLAWTLTWFSCIHDSPLKHPRISAEERELLSNLEVSEEKLSVPWRSILTSPPVWGTLVTDCCNTWGIVTLLSYGPTYLKQMLGVDIKTNGIISGLPMIARYIGGILFARLSDCLIRTGRIHILGSRRLFNSVSQVVPAVLMVTLPYSGCSVYTVTTVQVMLMFFNGAISSGHFASGVDLAPNYAGTLFGLTNTLSGGGMGALVPLVVGYITQGPPSWSSWTKVFWVAGMVYFTGNCFYVCLVKADPQPWNTASTNQPKEMPQAHVEKESESSTF